MAKIYTKFGDGGKTLLSNGRKVAKSCFEIGLLGDIDELNACLGLALINLRKPNSLKISKVQTDLFMVGSVVAGYFDVKTAVKNLLISTKELEDQIDSIQAVLPELKNFVIPGGCESSASVHVARAVCRRCERSLINLKKYKELIPYFNRLSDYLFILARYENYRHKVKEITINSARQ